MLTNEARNGERHESDGTVTSRSCFLVSALHNVTPLERKLQSRESEANTC